MRHRHDALDVMSTKIRRRRGREAIARDDPNPAKRL
jgi:hypothetical protein